MKSRIAFMGEGSAGLTRKAVLSVILLVATLGILLFVSAGTVRFWQGWIFWVVASVAGSLLTFYLLQRDPSLLQRRLRYGPAAEKEWSQKIIQAVTNVLSMAEFAISGLDCRFRWSHLPAGIAVLGDLLVCVGYAWVFLVFRENSFASVAIEVQPGQRVISTGPYRIVRHPMYTAMLLIVLATPLALGSCWALVCFPPVLLVVVWRLLREEKFLLRNLSGYDDFRRRTRWRLIPFGW